MVDLRSSTLNFLAGILRQAKALQACLSNPLKHVPGTVAEPPAAPEPESEREPVAGTSIESKDESEIEEKPRLEQLDSTVQIPSESEAGSETSTKRINEASLNLSGLGGVARPVQETEINVNPVEIPNARPLSAGAGRHERDESHPRNDDAQVERLDHGNQPPTKAGEVIPIVSSCLMRRYDRQRIYDLVWQMPLAEAAKNLGKTVEVLSAACLKLRIPTPPRGYWIRKHGERGTPPPLPEVKVDGPGPTDRTVTALIMSRYDREDLYEKVWQKPMSHLAAEYRVPREELSRRCRILFVPTPGSGYWERKAAGKAVKERPPLPPVTVVGFTWNTQKLDERKGRGA